MFSSTGFIGTVSVLTTSGRPHSPEEWAKLATNKIISVGDRSHPVITEQARAYREQIEQVISYYIAQAINADRAYRPKG